MVSTLIFQASRSVGTILVHSDIPTTERLTPEVCEILVLCIP